MESKTYTAFERLDRTLDTLRRECPWDRVQTLDSLRYLTIEEVHELSEAIVGGNADELKKELGDLAMHIMFYMKIAEEQGLFTAADVYNAICDKLEDRHPFIYHKDDYHGESWEQLKMREGRRNVLEGVPRSLPSMVAAVRMLEKVAGMRGPDWRPDAAAAADRLMDAATSPDPSPQPASNIKHQTSSIPPAPATEEGFGELLLGLVDWARRHGINADNALCKANNSFRQANS